MELCSIETMTWEKLATKGTAPSPRFGHICEKVFHNKLLVFGGGSVEKVYNDLHMLDLGKLTCSW